jgi:hypothetical protein
MHGLAYDFFILSPYASTVASIRDFFIPCSSRYESLPLFQGLFYSLFLALWMVASIPRIFLFPIPHAMDAVVACHDFFIPYLWPLCDNVACGRQSRNYYNFFHKSVACTGLMAPGPRHARSPKPAPGSTDRQSRLILRSPTTSEPILKI